MNQLQVKWCNKIKCRCNYYTYTHTLDKVNIAFFWKNVWSHVNLFISVMNVVGSNQLMPIASNMSSIQSGGMLENVTQSMNEFTTTRASTINKSNFWIFCCQICNWWQLSLNKGQNKRKCSLQAIELFRIWIISLFSTKNIEHSIPFFIGYA